MRQRADDAVTRRHRRQRTPLPWNPNTPPGILRNQSLFFRNAANATRPRGAVRLGLALEGAIALGLGASGIAAAIAPWAAAGNALFWILVRVACAAVSGVFALYGSLVLANLLLGGTRR